MKSRLNITIETPAQPGSRAGNRVTAERWRHLLESLGHRVRVTTGFEGASADLLIAIHAWRSADAINRFHQSYPDCPIVVCLSGTDIYKFQYTDPEVTLASLDVATALVGLHDQVAGCIPERFGAKLRIIHQSVPPIARRAPRADRFEVCVIAHLREEKDPLRAAYAARLLPSRSRIEISHAGRALDESLAMEARRETSRNPRYHWLGEISSEAVRELLEASRLMVLSSLMEGGANALGEAITAGVPVITSAIEGSLGLLGADYPGTYPVGDTAALAALLERAETDAAYLEQLTAACAARAPLFTPDREREAWRDLLEAVMDRR